MPAPAPSRPQPHQGPPPVAALDEGEEDQQDPNRRQENTGHVQSSPPGSARLRQHPSAEDKRGERDGDVDPEDRAPTQAPEVGVNERPAQQWAGDRGEPCTAPYAPNALAIAAGSNDDRMIPKTWGTMNPPASP